MEGAALYSVKWYRNEQAGDQYTYCIYSEKFRRILCIRGLYKEYSDIYECSSSTFTFSTSDYPAPLSLLQPISVKVL
jgi:hypothetical protein